MEDMAKEQLAELDRRLVRIEAFLATLGMPAVPADPPRAVPPPLPMPVPASERIVVAMPDEPAAPVLREVHADESRFGDILSADAAPEPDASQGMSVPVANAPTALPMVERPKEAAFSNVFPQPYSLPSRTAPASTTVEQAIGLKLAGWVGAIVVVIGAAMGVKFAYDQGWLGGMPDSVKLGLFYSVGIALIGAGEYVYRRVNPVAAVGVYAAGIAGLFVVSFAGNAYYQLYEQPVAFMLMAGACGIGALISLRGGLVSIAILSLLGANIAPLILRNRAVGEVPLLVYLFALQVLALGLAHVGKGARWWILRNFALTTLSLWMAMRLMSPTTAFSLPTMLFLCLYATLFQLENALAAKKQGVETFSHPTFSFAVTAMMTIALLRWSMPLADGQRGAIVVLLSFIAFTAGSAVYFAKQEKLKQLGLSWLVQGGILLFAAVPVALSGPWIFVAWSVMALGYVVLGAVLNRKRTAAAGVLIWFVASLFLLVRIVTDVPGESLRATAFESLGTAIPTYFVIGLLIAAIGHAMTIVLSRRFQSAEEGPSHDAYAIVPQSIAITATFLAAVVCVAALPSLATSGAGVVIAWACFALAFASRSTANVYRALAGSVMSLTLARWVAMDLIAERITTKDLTAYRLVFNSTLGMGVLCVGSLWAMARLMGRRIAMPAESYSRLVCFAILFGVFAVCVGLSIEVERAVQQAVAAGSVLNWPPAQLVQFGWTALWAIAAALLPLIAKAMAVHPRLRDELKTASTFLVSIVAAKFLITDCLGFAVQHFDTRAGTLVNTQTVLATLLVALLVYCVRTTPQQVAKNIARSVVFLLPLIVGSIELARIVGPRKTLVAFSVYWGLYAIGSIAVGFVLRTAVLRFAGLGLLGITLLKIVFVDLANAGTGWRILSFLGLGTILLATSVLYGKLSPKLLGKEDETSASSPRG